MSTRSFIGRINPDNSVTIIYCHWDGYPEHQLPILYYSYSNEEKLTALLDLGSISYLDENVTPPEHKKHDHFFNHPVPDVTLAYHRDRGDPWEECKPETYPSLENLLNGCDDNYWIEYYYIFDGDKWLIYDRHGEEIKYELLDNGNFVGNFAFAEEEEEEI